MMNDDEQKAFDGIVHNFKQTTTTTADGQHEVTSSTTTTVEGQHETTVYETTEIVETERERERREAFARGEARNKSMRESRERSERMHANHQARMQASYQKRDKRARSERSDMRVGRFANIMGQLIITLVVILVLSRLVFWITGSMYHNTWEQENRAVDCVHYNVLAWDGWEDGC